MPTTKENISDWAIRIGRISMEIGHQLNHAKVQGFSKYMLGLTSRTAIILQDIHFLLKDNPNSQLTSSFILFRCLLDDFITLLYFQSGNFNEEELIAHTAEAHRQWFKMQDESKSINDIYFGGENKTIANADYILQKKTEFINNPVNDVYFVNKQLFKFKPFSTTAKIIADLPSRFTKEKFPIAIANVHAYVLWKLLSKYVHYSLWSYQLETSPASRVIEIDQLKEILGYCYKTVQMTSDYLNKAGLKHEFRDTSNVYANIFDGIKQA